MKSVFLAIPSHSGQISLPTLLSIVQAIAENRALGWPDPQVQCIGGDADLARARNVLLALFYESTCTDLWLVDSDVSWGAGTFTRLMAHGADFVAGAYRFKTDDKEAYPVHWTQPKRMAADVDSGAPLLAAELVPAGFVRLTRAAVTRMFEHAATPWLLDTERGRDIEFPELFEWTRDGRRRLSEDYTFCKRWRDIGGGIWVDPALALDHTGQKTFEGDLYAYLAREVNVHRAQTPLLERVRALAGA